MSRLTVEIKPASFFSRKFASKIENQGDQMSRFQKIAQNVAQSFFGQK
jgi:hypothetical protein